MSLRNLLNLRAVLRVPNETVNTQTGFPRTSWSDGASVRCALQATSSNESRRWQREAGSTIYWLYLPFGTEIKTTYRVKMETGAYANKHLAVIGPPQDEAGRGSHFRVPCEFIEGGGAS